MNKDEFEEAVRELRARQRRYFRCGKDDPDKQMAKEMMREQEVLLRDVVGQVMAVRQAGKKPENEREEFFLAVAEMLRLQKVWMKSPNFYNRDKAREGEKAVDRFLQKWDEEVKEALRKAEEELRAKQLTLF